jgi:hypothetical protein
MKMYVEWGKDPCILDICIGGEWSASRSGLFTSREGACGMHWIRGCMNPRASLDVVAEKNPWPLSGMEPQFLQPLY